MAGAVTTDKIAAFQSTHPVRGATAVFAADRFDAVISIHAPREGCDQGVGAAGLSMRNFNPRTP